MEPVSQLHLDNMTPGDEAMMIHGPQSVILKHGGVITRMRFKSVQGMSLDTFKKVEVPKMTTGEAERSLYYVRNTLDGAVTLILDDQVIKYNLTGIEECGLDKIGELIKDEVQATGKTITAPNLPWSLVAIVQSEYKRDIIIRLPEQHRRFYMPVCDVDVKIWYPPLWAKVHMPSSGGTAYDMSLVVEQAYNREWEKTELKNLVLPNVYLQDGSICFGQVVLSTALSGKKTDADIIMGSLTMFFDSEFNDHLLQYYDLQRVLGNAYDDLPPDKYFEDRIRKHYGCEDFLRVLRVMKEKNGWRRLNLPQFPLTPADFVG